MRSETPALTDPQTPPSPAKLKSVLGESYIAFKALMGTIRDAPFRFAYEWRYYRDGKAWLCKVTCKKKTVFWLSAWKGYFKTSFYFTAKNIDEIAALPISRKTKDAFAKGDPARKLLPLVLVIKAGGDLNEVLHLAEYKMGKL